MRGTAIADPMHLCDYCECTRALCCCPDRALQLTTPRASHSDVTFAFLAGVDPTDHRAAAAGLPGIDGVNLWPRLSGTNTSAPRLELWAGPNVFISRNYKLLLSPSETYAVWTGPHSPNATTELVSRRGRS
jgi:hypothetical protein